MMNETAMPQPPTDETPLQGWKEIAAYLGRDQRTARRWEAEEGLPVRRHRTDRRSSVYAFPSEIQAWRTSHQRAASEPETAAPASPIRPWMWGVAAAAVALGGFLSFLRSTPSVDPSVEAAGGITTTEICACNPQGSNASVSPDGRYLTETDWETSGEIGIRDLQTGTFRKLGPKDSWEKLGEADDHIFSPDGQQIAYNWLVETAGGTSYELRIVDAFGENPQIRTVFFDPALSYLRPVAWTADNRILVTFQGDSTRTLAGVGWVGIDSGQMQVVKTLTGKVGAMASHDGRWIAFDAEQAGGNTDVFVMAGDGSGERAVAAHGASDLVMGFSADDKTLLFASSRTGSFGLWGQPLSNGAPVGEPKLLLRDIGNVTPMGVLPDGGLIYQRPVGSRDLVSAELDMATGRVVRAPQVIETKYQGENQGPWFSPDGSRFIYRVPAAGGPGPTTKWHFYLRDVRTRAEREIVAGVNTQSQIPLEWSGDGKHILILAVQPVPYERYLLDIDVDTGEVQRWPGIGFAGWDSAAQTVIGRNKGEILETILGGASRRIHLVPEPAGVMGLKRSPGFDLVAWREWVPPRTESIKVIPIAGGNPRTLLQGKPGEVLGFPSFTWLPDQSALLVPRESSGENSETLWIVPIDAGPLRQTDLTDILIRNLAVLPDGKTVVYQRGNLDPRVFRTDNYLPQSGGR